MGCFLPGGQVLSSGKLFWIRSAPLELTRGKLTQNQERDPLEPSVLRKDKSKTKLPSVRRTSQAGKIMSHKCHPNLARNKQLELNYFSESISFPLPALAHTGQRGWRQGKLFLLQASFLISARTSSSFVVAR